MDLEVADVPYETIIAKGNDILEGASDASGIGSKYVLNDGGL